jgi:osmoprotectant transport system ATP-binding protein
LTAAFTLRAVQKDFRGRRVLGPLDLEIPAGATTVLLGPSGCGKSTLLRVLVGLIAPDRGELRFQGAPLDFDARLRMGYGIQDGGLFPHLTAAGNATLMARHLRWAPDKIDGRLDELATLTHFPRELLGHYPAELSGGQRQRVSLMRALMLDPSVLLLDEPLGALDPMIRADLQAELRAIFRSLGKTVVLVTHDLAEAGYLGDRIVLLRDGAIVQIGPLDDLRAAPAEPFVTRFVQAQLGARA